MGKGKQNKFKKGMLLPTKEKLKALTRVRDGKNH